MTAAPARRETVARGPRAAVILFEAAERSGWTVNVSNDGMDETILYLSRGLNAGKWPASPQIVIRVRDVGEPSNAWITHRGEIWIDVVPGGARMADAMRVLQVEAEPHRGLIDAWWTLAMIVLVAALFGFALANSMAVVQ